MFRAQVARTQIRRQHNAGVMAVFAQWIDMHHAMLYEREVGFNSCMHSFSNMMRVKQGKIVLDADFNVNINTAAEKTGVQAV